MREILLSLMPSKKRKNDVGKPWTGFGAGRGEGVLTLCHIWLTSSVLQHVMHSWQGAADLFEPFSHMVPLRVDLLGLFGRFDAMRKKHVFPIDQTSTQNHSKSINNRQKGRHVEEN